MVDAHVLGAAADPAVDVEDPPVLFHPHETVTTQELSILMSM